MSDSLASRLASFAPDELARLLDGLTVEQVQSLVSDWRFSALPAQRTILESEAHTLIYSGGRGVGKTRTGSMWVKRKIDMYGPVRIHLLGRTSADVRDVMVQGSSWIIAEFPQHKKPVYTPSQRKLTFHDGSVALLFSAEEPSQLRGPQSDFTWADELAALDFTPDDSGLSAWDNALIGTRLGRNPQVLATTTPKRVPVVVDLYARAAANDPDVCLVSTTTYQNPYLGSTYLDIMTSLYEHTRIGKQELMGELLTDVEGAVLVAGDFTFADTHPHLPNIVVGVDPSVSAAPGDECGIVVVGADAGSVQHRTAYVLADASIQGTPAEWSQRVSQVAAEYNATVVVETNQGGRLVIDAIKSFNPKIRVVGVNAKVGKQLRAEPVVSLYQQHRVVHVGKMSALEDQWLSWVPGVSKDSPDRVDALVHAVSALMWGREFSGPVTVSRPRGRIPVGRQSKQMVAADMLRGYRAL